jgi:hypothetical protein
MPDRVLNAISVRTPFRDSAAIRNASGLRLPLSLGDPPYRAQRGHSKRDLVGVAGDER